MERIATFNVVSRKNIVHEREYDYWRRGLFESNSKKLEDMFGNADGFKWLTQ